MDYVFFPYLFAYRDSFHLLTTKNAINVGVHKHLIELHILNLLLMESH